jgi:hypothetical protein
MEGDAFLPPGPVPLPPGRRVNTDGHAVGHFEAWCVSPTAQLERIHY